MQSQNGDVELSVTLSTKDLKSDVQKIKNEIQKGIGKDTTGDIVSKSNTTRSTKNVGQLTNALERAKEEARELAEQIKELEGVKAPTEEYTKLQNSAAWLEKEMAKVNEQIDHLSLVTGSGVENPKLDKAIEQYGVLEEALKNVQTEMQKLESTNQAYTEQAVPELENLKTQYNAIVDKIALMVEKEEQANRKGSVDEIIGQEQRLAEQIRETTLAGNEEQIALTPTENLIDYLTKVAMGFKYIGENVLGVAVPALIKFNVTLLKITGRTVLKGLHAIGTALKNAVGKALNTVANKLKEVVQRFKDMKKHSGNAFNLGQILGYAIGIRGLFSLFSKLRQVIVEGMKNLAQWNNGNNKTNESISMLMTSLAQMKNALTSAFAPILTVVAPLLNQLINLVTQAANAIAQFIAMISGQSTWLRAKKNAQDYAKTLGGVGGAADKASGKLAAFDDLNVLGKDDNGGGGGGGGINPNDMFEEVSVEPWVTDWLDKLKKMWENADFTELGAIVGEWLKNALDSIPWDKIKEVVAKIAKSIATFLNGFFETEGLGTSIGNTLAEALNTAFTFLYEFAKNLHWDSIGKFIGEALLAFIDTIDVQLIGNAIAEKWKGIIDLAYNLMSTLTDGKGFEKLGEKIATLFTTFFENMGTIDPEVGLNAWQKLGEILSQGIEGLLITLTTVIGEFDWSNIGNALGDAISSIDWESIGIDFTNFAYSIFDALIDTLDSLPIEELGDGIMELIYSIDWKGLAWDLSAFADSLFDAIYRGIKSIDWVGVGEAIGQFIAGIDWLGIAGDIWDVFWAAVGAALGLVWGVVKEIGKAIIEGLWEGIQGAMSWLAQKWEALWDWIIDLFMSIFGIHSPSTVFAEFGKMIIQGLINGINSVLQFLYNLWTDIKNKIIEIATNLWEGVKTIWTNLWNDITTIATNIWNALVTVWTTIKDTVVGIVTALWTGITTIWTNIHTGVTTWWENIKKAIVDKVIEMKTAAENKVGEMRDKIVEKWEALRDKTTEKFKKIKDAVVKAWEGVKEGIKKPINGILSFIEGMINKIIDGLNWFIEKLNSIKMEVVNPFDSSQKYTLGFDLEPLENISIPRLAQGAVIPPNKQFLAMLGDQKYGTNIEAPLDTIKEAFADVVGNLNVQNTGNAVMQVDGKTFARLMTPYVVSELERRGYNVAVMEA